MSALHLNLKRIDGELRSRFWNPSMLASSAKCPRSSVYKALRIGRAGATLARKLATALDLTSDEILLPTEKRRRHRKTA